MLFDRTLLSGESFLKNLNSGHIILIRQVVEKRLIKRNKNRKLSIKIAKNNIGLKKKILIDFI